MKFDALVRFLVLGEFISIRVVGANEEFVRVLRNAYLAAGGTGRVVSGALPDWTDSITLVSPSYLLHGYLRCPLVVRIEFERLLAEALAGNLTIPQAGGEKPAIV